MVFHQKDDHLTLKIAQLEMVAQCESATSVIDSLSGHLTAQQIIRLRDDGRKVGPVCRLFDWRMKYQVKYGGAANGGAGIYFTISRGATDKHLYSTAACLASLSAGQLQELLLVPCTYFRSMMWMKCQFSESSVTARLFRHKVG